MSYFVLISTILFSMSYSLLLKLIMVQNYNNILNYMQICRQECNNSY
jgi:hypothetical protein